MQVKASIISDLSIPPATGLTINIIFFQGFISFIDENN
jgi:hypothetical protein